MKKLLFAAALVLAAALALPELAHAYTLTDAQKKEATDRLGQAKDAGIPLDHTVYSDPDGTDRGLRDNLKKHRIVKGKDWNAMTPEQRKTAIDNAKALNPDRIYIDLRTGDVYSYSEDDADHRAVRDEAFNNGKLDLPDGILTDEQKAERERLRREAQQRRDSQGHADARRGGHDRDRD